MHRKRQSQDATLYMYCQQQSQDSVHSVHIAIGSQITVYTVYALPAAVTRHCAMYMHCCKWQSLNSVYCICTARCSGDSVHCMYTASGSHRTMYTVYALQAAVYALPVANCRAFPPGSGGHRTTCTLHMQCQWWSLDNVHYNIIMQC